MTDEMLEAADRRIYLPMCACAAPAPAPSTPPPHAPLAPLLPSVGARARARASVRPSASASVSAPARVARPGLASPSRSTSRSPLRSSCSGCSTLCRSREGGCSLCRKQGGSDLGRLALRRPLSAPDHASGCSELRPSLANQPLGPRWPAIIGLGFHSGCPRKRWTACVDRGTAASRDQTPRAKSLRASRTWVERCPSATRGGRKTSGTRDAGSPSRLPQRRLRCIFGVFWTYRGGGPL